MRLGSKAPSKKTKKFLLQLVSSTSASCQYTRTRSTPHFGASSTVRCVGLKYFSPEKTIKVFLDIPEAAPRALWRRVVAVISVLEEQLPKNLTVFLYPSLRSLLPELASFAPHLPPFSQDKVAQDGLLAARLLQVRRFTLRSIESVALGLETVPVPLQ